MNWMQTGAFTAASEVISDGNRRVLTTIFPGEPIITAKITGENGRNGVAGFVQPGDRVDILITKNDDNDDGVSATTLMEYVKILSVDQNAGSRNETAQLASSVTIETDAKGAKKIAWGLQPEHPLKSSLAKTSKSTTWQSKALRSLKTKTITITKQNAYRDYDYESGLEHKKQIA